MHRSLEAFRAYQREYRRRRYAEDAGYRERLKDTNRRYKGTAKGMLAEVRAKAAQRRPV